MLYPECYLVLLNEGQIGRGGVKHLAHGSQQCRNILLILQPLMFLLLQDISASSSTLITTAVLYFHSLRSLSFLYNLPLLTITDHVQNKKLPVGFIIMHLTQLLLLAGATLTLATPYHSWRHHSWDGEDDCTAEEESPSSTSPAGLSTTAPGGYEAPTSVAPQSTATTPSQSSVQPVEPAPVGPATDTSSSATPASSSTTPPIQSETESATAAAPPSSSSSAASAPPPSSSALIATFTECVPPLLPLTPLPSLPSQPTTNPFPQIRLRRLQRLSQLQHRHGRLRLLHQSRLQRRRLPSPLWCRSRRRRRLCLRLVL